MHEFTQCMNHKQEEKRSVKCAHVLNLVISGVGSEAIEIYVFKDLHYFEILFKLHRVNCQ